MRKIPTVLLAMMVLVFSAFFSAQAKSERASDDLKLYINDELAETMIYENYESYRSWVYNDYLPLRATLDAIGYGVEWREPCDIIINRGINDVILMRINNTVIDYLRINNDLYPTLDEKFKPMLSLEYINVDGSIYCPIYTFTRVFGCHVYRDADSIYLDSGKYYKQVHTVYNNIGRRINVSVYINNTRIDSQVYENTSNIYDGNTFSDFVELRPVFEAIGAELEFVAPNKIVIKRDGAEYAVFRAKKAYSDGMETSYADGMEDCYIVDGKTYIRFSEIRYIIDGALKQTDEQNMYLYTKEFERTDIPATLHEAYVCLDGILSEDNIEYIKACKPDELISMHMSLGMWIRNNWIYPSKTRIVKQFYDKGITIPDDISMYIIEGYNAYLNGLPCDLSDIIK